ncbi:LOW QUALITY PROTEIN: phosphorylated adapter RNA export protein-like [Pecten maximus]|uniref:LOW QUALITY PROTEIN: phosphorylated adapter RNA export protein-like n=1 Tax=Pecten maximus TaxID=6579 RepID=UPI001458A65A|nr:LOW QUALITY PROTEIN: phosphorylated adapter RNA export protein-like [Pecten maximus]
MADLEDGEIPDSDEEVPSSLPNSKPDDVSMNYPHAGGDVPSSFSVRQPSTKTTLSYNNHTYRSRPSNPPVDSEDDSSGTSDEDTDLWQCKKAKYFSKPRVQSMDLAHEITSPPRGMKPPSMTQDEDPLESPQKKRKVNNVWGTVITEQTITHSFKTGANVDKNEDCLEERDVESYDYTKAYDDDRPCLVEQRTIQSRESNDPFENVIDSIEELYDVETKKSDVESRKRKRSVKDRVGRKEHQSMKDRIGEKERQSVKERLGKNEEKNVKDRLGQIDPNISRIEDVNERDPEEKVTKAILDMLDEPNTDLIGRIVSVIGRTLALKFAHQTEDVESAGGLLTNDGARRRTPGGVYLQLLKNSKDITKEQTKEIFAEEELKYKREQRKIKRAKRKRQNQLRKMLPQSNYASQKSKGGRKQDVEMRNENMPEVDDCNDDSDEEDGQQDIAQEIEAAKQQQVEARKMDDSEFSLNDSDVVDIELGEFESFE